MKPNTRIAIAGAGLGGLTAALALQQRGFDVTVYEQAPALGEVGAGLQLGANAMHVLSSLGLREQLTARASVPAGKEVRLWNSGRTWKLFDLGPESENRYGAPYLLMHRADLHGVLTEAFETRSPGQIQLGKRLERFDEDESSVRLHFTDGSTAIADVLIGADGVHSVVRTQLFGGSTPAFSGCMAWRGVVAQASLAPQLRDRLATNWVGPGAHVIHYPLRGGELLNLVGIVERNDWQVESWSTPGSTLEWAEDFRGWHDDVLQMIRSIESPMKWALMLRPTMETWSSDRVTLLGDSCHPTLPFLAQGSAMAIEDGVVLARALEMYDDPAKALSQYENARIGRTTAVVDGSAANISRFHNPALSDDTAADYVADEWSEANVAQRYDWLFSYDALQTPI